MGTALSGALKGHAYGWQELPRVKLTAHAAHISHAPKLARKGRVMRLPLWWEW